MQLDTLEKRHLLQLPVKEIMGFDSKLDDFEKKARALFDDSELTCQPAKCVNQWKYKKH